MFVLLCAQSLSRVQLCDPMDCNQAPVSMRILRARILDWVAMPSSRDFYLYSAIIIPPIRSGCLKTLFEYVCVTSLQSRETWVRSLCWKIPQRREWIHTPHSDLENSMDRGAWQATAHGVTKSRTPLSDFHFHLKQVCFKSSCYSEVKSSAQHRKLQNQVPLVRLQDCKAVGLFH